MPSTQAYGEWTFDFYKGAAGNFVSVSLTSDTKTALPTTGYTFLARATDNNLQMKEYPGATVHINTGFSYYENATWYRIRITRSAVGVWGMWIRGGAFSGWTLVGTATDNTSTTSNYFVLDFDAGDKVANIVFKPLA
jgi:hypothetical protein